MTGVSLPVRRIISIFKLIRIHNAILAGVGIWMGWYLAGPGMDETKIYLASIAGALVCGAGNAVNDFFDIDSDRINHPLRPLPAGEIPPYIAILVGIIYNAAAVVLALLVNVKVTGVVLFAILLLFIYNIKLKRIPFWGNFAVALLGGLTFMTGALVLENFPLWRLPGPLVPAVFAFLFHFGRELVKDVEDFHGDNQAEFRTLASLIPRWSVHLIIALLFTALIALTIIPMVNHWYLKSFNYIVIFFVDLPLLGLIVYLFADGKHSRYKIASNILKVLMLAGLIAFFAGKDAIF